MSLSFVGGNCDVSFGDWLAHIRSAVERAVSDGAEVLDDLGIETTPEALQAIAALRNIDDDIECELVVRALVLHLAVLLSERELWEPAELAPDGLRAALELIAPLGELEGRIEEKFAASIGDVDPRRRPTIEKLHASLRLPDDALHAASVVGPELLRLAEAAARGTLAEAAPTLSETEIEAVTAALAPAVTGAQRTDRVQLDAVALRTLMERDLADYRAAKSGSGASRSRLEAEHASNEFIARRLEAVRSERFLKTRTHQRSLDVARRSLFTVYVEISKILEARQSLRLVEHPAQEKPPRPKRRRAKILDLVAAAISPFGGAGSDEDRDDK